MTRVVRQLRRRAGEERGGVLVFVAVGLPAFILFGAFVIDVGNWWVHKRHLQVQADAAALAGAKELRYPGCDDNRVAAEAIRYSGGQLWDTTPASYAAASAEHNLQLGGTDPLKVFAGINRPTVYDRTEVIDEDLVDSPKPCAAGFVDVKATETDLPWFFALTPAILDGLGLTDQPAALDGATQYIDAQARVQLQGVEEMVGMLPIGVEDVNPRRVHVWFYDEETGAELGDAELYRNGDDGNGHGVWDNSAGNPNEDAMPARFSVHGPRVGVKVAMSGSDSITCGDPLVLCKGAATEGLTRIRGFDPDATSGFRLHQLYLVKESASCALLDNGYFSHTCNEVSLRAATSGIAAGGSAEVTARIQWKNSSKSQKLTYNAATGLWESPAPLPIADLGDGSRTIDILWKQTSGTVGAQACTNGKPCEGTVLNAHKVFTASRENAGPIKELRVDVDGQTNTNNVARCAAAATCDSEYVVRLALSGRLELAKPTDPPITLRIQGRSVNQSLNCDPAETQMEREVANGCPNRYARNTGQACPNNHNDLWSSPPPWRCVRLKTGTDTQAPTLGLNERILCKPPNSAGNCSQFGRPATCTNPNRFPATWTEADPRILPVFVVPFGTFDTTGGGTVPVLDFAHFYVTAWASNGAGNENPCPIPPDRFSPDNFDKTGHVDNGAISGNFVKPATTNNGGASGEACDLSSISGCVAVMTK